MANYYLLTGAGFSQNFGGYSSEKLWDLLLSHRKTQANKLLQKKWRESHDYGFEDALEVVRKLSEEDASWQPSYRDMQTILREVFIKMDESFDTDNLTQLIICFINLLRNFHCIFSTNQDCFVENKLTLDIQFRCSSPGLSPIVSSSSFPNISFTQKAGLMAPNQDNIRKPLYPCGIPYIKLHGSHNWQDQGGQLMIVGGRKEEDIQRYDLIKWYFEIFREKLSQPESRLLILGYSFSDRHINEIIFNAVKRGGLKFYIWNPSGEKGALEAVHKLNQNDENLFDEGFIGQCREKIAEVYASDEHFNIIREQFFLMNPRIYSGGIIGPSQW